MKRRTVTAIVAGAVAAAVIVGGAVWALTPRPQSAQDAAEHYLAALSTGDVETISSMRSDLLPDQDEQTLRTAFESASDYVAQPRVDSTTKAGESIDGTVDVRATAELAGRDIEVAFALRREGDRWMLSDDYLGTLTVTAATANGTVTSDAVWIGAALAPAGTAVALLPASYAVSAAPRELLDGASTVSVSSGARLDIALETALTPRATSRAQEELAAYATECTVAATAVPPNCGLKVPWAADLATLASIAYRVERLPAVELASQSDMEFAATGGVVVATATGTTPAGEPASFTYRTEDWALRGSIAFRGDEMLLSVR